MDGWVEIGSFWKYRDLADCKMEGVEIWKLEQSVQLCENTGESANENGNVNFEFGVPATEVR